MSPAVYVREHRSETFYRLAVLSLSSHRLTHSMTFGGESTHYNETTLECVMEPESHEFMRDAQERGLYIDLGIQFDAWRMIVTGQLSDADLSMLWAEPMKARYVFRATTEPKKWTREWVEA